MSAIWKFPESSLHALASFSAREQSKYLERHNSALNKVLCFELLRDEKLINELQPSYSSVQPKPLYENSHVQAYWDIPVFTEHNEVRANRVDARIVGFHSGDQQPCFSTKTKEKDCIIIEVRIPRGFGRQQHGCQFHLHYTSVKYRPKGLFWCVCK